MKPILFNTDMVCALLDNRKTATRRVVKPQPSVDCSHGGTHEFIRDDFTEETHFTGYVCKKCGYGVCPPHFKYPVGTSWIRPPYRPDDILYVRETWAELETVHGVPYYAYKADDEILHHSSGENFEKWRPSIHMPREAARIFLRVTNVSVAKLQDITPDEIAKEGIQSKKPEWLRTDFADTWNSTVKSADLALYGWEANPWVWVIEFERISREEAMNHAI